MQGKSLVKFFLILLSFVCLLQFLYFIPTNRVEKNADEFALKMGGTDVKSVAYKLARSKYLDSMSSETIFSIPLIKSYSYSELKQQQLALGLDLKGGMSMVLQVNLEDFLKGLAGRNANNAEFVKAIENAKKAQTNSQSDFITLFTQEYRTIAGENKMSRVFGQSEALGSVNSTTDDATLTRLLRSKANETVNSTFDRLKQRIDKLGVVQPNISLDASRDLILVELPGVENKERAREMITASAKLEFWDTYRFNDAGIAGALQEADRRSGGAAIDSTASTTTAMDSVATPVFDDLGNVTDTIMKAVNSAAPTPGAITGGGKLSKALTINAGTMAQTVLGRADKAKQSLINEMLARPDIKSLFPADSKFLWSYKPAMDADGLLTKQYELYLIKKNSNSDVAPLDGEVITSADQTLNSMKGTVEVNVQMNAEGARKWGEMTTKANQNGNREIAIALDDFVVSAPTVNQPILGGSSSISGNYTVEEAIDFASILEVGKLPAKLEPIQESSVGPSLGKENINKSLFSLGLGFMLVIGIMIFYYSGAGVISVLTLLLNVFLIFGILSSFHAVMTLPGIAGIVLTIGMAVDANVIIYERIKEELELGKDIKTAVADGFKHSYVTIIDANVTTILTAIILAYFGLGPVRGFAIVLIIGVITSLFTAMFISRLMIEWWIGRGNNLSFWTSYTKGAFKSINVDWIGIRKYTYIISGGLTIFGLASVFIKGFDLGVEYKGGYSYNVAFAGSGMTADKLRDGLTTTFEMAPIVKEVNDANSFSITTSYLINDGSKEASAKVDAKLLEGINAIAGTNTSIADFTNTDAPDDKTHIISSAKVGPVIADDLKNTSLIALILAIVVIFLYILLRFNKWQYSFGAIVALLHDAFMVIGIFSLLKGLVPFTLEVDQAFIAAILTIIGYSINDTVIIFDRIREYIGLYPNKSNKEVINDAINSTLSRTTMISFTLFIVIFVLFLFGGDSIKGFAFALTIGIFIGTYSSILIASPIVYDFTSDLRMKRSREDKKKVG